MVLVSLKRFITPSFFLVERVGLKLLNSSG